MNPQAATEPSSTRPVASTEPVPPTPIIPDPTMPEPLTAIDDIPSHKVGLVPGTPFIYNARSDGGTTGAPVPVPPLQFVPNQPPSLPPEPPVPPQPPQ